MFGKKSKKREESVSNQEEKVIFKTSDYIMKDSFDADNLVIANLEYISNRATDAHTPMVCTTSQKYLFEKFNDNGKERYREVFTGFIADTDSSFFNLPYVTNIKSLKEEVSNVSYSIPKYGLLLLMNEINRSKKVK